MNPKPWKNLVSEDFFILMILSPDLPLYLRMSHSHFWGCFYIWVMLFGITPPSKIIWVRNCSTKLMHCCSLNKWGARTTATCQGFNQLEYYIRSGQNLVFETRKKPRNPQNKSAIHFFCLTLKVKLLLVNLQTSFSRSWAKLISEWVNLSWIQSKVKLGVA